MATNITISTGGTTTVVTVPEVQNNVTVSRNEITTDERTKLAGIEDGATADQVIYAGTNINVSEVDGDYTINLDDSVSLSGSLSVTGGITGDVTGNVTGDLEGDVTGNVSGNAGTVTDGIYTTSSIGDLSDVSTTGVADDHVLVSDSSGNFTPKSTFEAFLSSASQYSDSIDGPLALGADLNGDGAVTTADLLLFLANFGTTVSDLGAVRVFFTSDPSYVNINPLSNTLNQTNYAFQTSTTNLYQMELSSPTTSDNYGSFSWVYNSIDDTIDFLGGQEAAQWHLSSEGAKLMILEPTEMSVQLGADNVNTWISLYVKIVNSYATDDDREFVVRIGNYFVSTLEETITIPVNNGVHNAAIGTQYFVKSTNLQQRPQNIKLSFWAGTPGEYENGFVKVRFNSLKLKIAH